MESQEQKITYEKIVEDYTDKFINDIRKAIDIENQSIKDTWNKIRSYMDKKVNKDIEIEDMINTIKEYPTMIDKITLTKVYEGSPIEERKVINVLACDNIQGQYYDIDESYKYRIPGLKSANKESGNYKIFDYINDKINEGYKLVYFTRYPNGINHDLFLYQNLEDDEDNDGNCEG